MLDPEALGGLSHAGEMPEHELDGAFIAPENPNIASASQYVLKSGDTFVVNDPFGEATGPCESLHDPDYTRAAVGFVDAIRGAFSFLSARSQAEERIAQYIIREHHRGRPLAEILNDHYVTNRMTPEQVRRLLDRPELVHELGDDLIVDARTQL